MYYMALFTYFLPGEVFTTTKRIQNAYICYCVKSNFEERVFHRGNLATSFFFFLSNGIFNFAPSSSAFPPVTLRLAKSNV